MEQFSINNILQITFMHCLGSECWITHWFLSFFYLKNMLFLFISLSSEKKKKKKRKTLGENLNSTLPLGYVPCNMNYCTCKHIRITILSDGYKCLTSVKREEKLERKMFCFSMTSVTNFGVAKPYQSQVCWFCCRYQLGLASRGI